MLLYAQTMFYIKHNIRLSENYIYYPVYFTYIVKISKTKYIMPI